MAVPVVQPDRRHRRGAARSGRRAAIASLLMIPALLVTFTLGELAGAGLQAAFGLAESESLTEAGALGVLAGVLLTLLLVVPQVIGVVLGVEARRLGESRLGLIGLSANLVIGAYLLLASGLSLILG